jgi:hypothetical protein
MKRAMRYRELADEAKRRGGRGDAVISSVLSREEMAELSTLSLTLDAQEREQNRRQAAIDPNIAAGRFRRMKATPLNARLALAGQGKGV